ncbi:MAG TPA: molecular chaperone DnaJ, partial [Anaeromyxobacter sp.]
AEPPRPAPRAGAPRVRASVRPEDLPRRRLRFAEYLYYSGRVRWSELVEAIAWQRAQRPPIGRIAVQLRYLAHDDVGVILERRRLAGANATPFGEWAVRLGYLSAFQVLAMLGQQLRWQRPIGQYFVERGILEPGDVEDVRRRITRHNTRFRA